MLIQINAARRLPDEMRTLKQERDRTMTSARRLAIFRKGVLAGATGGFAEIAWVSVYASLTGGDAAALARGVTTAAGLGTLLPASPAALGLAVHMTLAVALGLALAVAWEALCVRRRGLTNPYPFMLSALGSVWAINFLIVLPIVSPAFVEMVPYAVSLTSKLLFGVAAAETMRRQALNVIPAFARRRK